MTVFTKFLSKMIFLRFISILSSFCFFVVTLQIIANIDDVLKKIPIVDSSLIGYALLLLPGTAATFFLISILLATLLTLVELNGRHELPIIWACGLSPYQVIGMLAPLGLVLGGAYFLLANLAIPYTAPKLDAWGIGERALKQAENSASDLWMRAGSDVIKARSVAQSGAALGDVTVFRRNDQGQLEEVIFAREAEQVGGTSASKMPAGVQKMWRLSHGVSYRVGASTSVPFDVRFYKGAMRPAVQGVRSGNPEAMSLNLLHDFIVHAGYGIRPVYLYETWWHRRVTFFLTPLLLMALCVPMATRFKRGGDAGRLFAFGVSLGFCFSILDGISLSMGEIGVVHAWFAGWAPFLVFLCILFAISFHYEKI